MATPSDNLQTLQSALTKIVQDEGDPSAHAAEFWDAFYDLYLLTLKGTDQAVTTAFADVRKASATDLEQQMYVLESAQFDRLESKLNSIWEYDEWLTICRQKSAMEGFNELCSPQFSDPYKLGIDGEFDADLKARADKDGFASNEEDPALFPETHWWWSHNKPIGKFGM